jgi:SPP1 family predicted phage head-tail adaptor
MISAGIFDQRIQLQTRAPGTNALGERTGAWQTVATVWAAVEPVRSRETVALGGTAVALHDVKFTIRYRADVTGAWRILWRNRPYEIQGDPVDVAAARDRLELLATAGVRDGR